MHFAHQVVRAQHPAHVHGQRQRDAHRKPFRYGHDDQRNGYHEVLQYLGGDRQPIGAEQIADDHALDEQRDERNDRQRYTYPSDQFRQLLQLQVQRGLLLAFDRGLFGYVAELGRVADGRDRHRAVSFDYRRAAHRMIRRIGSLGIEVSRVGRLVDLRFAGQRRLVDLQRDGFRQPSVGWYFLAALQDHRVADYDVALGYLGHVAVADDLDRRVVVGAVQHVEFFHRVVLEPEGDARGEEDCAEDTDRLGELVMDESYAERKQGGDQQDADHRIVELLEKEPPQRLAFGRGQHVGSVPLPALLDFGSGEPFRVV